MEGTSAVMMICDFGKEKSLEKAIDWKHKIEKVWLTEEENAIPFFLIANKCDIYASDNDDTEKCNICLREIAIQNSFSNSFMVSAKINKNIEECFITILKILMNI